MGKIIAYQTSMVRHKTDRQRYFREKYSKERRGINMDFSQNVSDMTGRICGACASNDLESMKAELLNKIEDGLLAGAFLMINARYDSETEFHVEPVQGVDYNWYFAMYTDMERAKASVNFPEFGDVYKVRIDMMFQEVLANERISGVCINPDGKNEILINKDDIRMLCENRDRQIKSITS